MRKSSVAMPKPFSALFLIFLPVGGFSQSDGFCCDINAGGSYNGFSCQQSFNQGTSEFWDSVGADNLVCDIDCPGGVDSGCATIPLDGGLSLLAIAGGGLATAAMRRRREEDEAAQESA
ncbi:MAG: hypothetical protein VXZ28_02215 [Bacteroidota bacterium]|nr:hypothetical protein [Bacteroidota bacterium]MEC8400126.1 hypothetical protein [Bacteroidota bacterium]